MLFNNKTLVINFKLPISSTATALFQTILKAFEIGRSHKMCKIFFLEERKWRLDADLNLGIKFWSNLRMTILPRMLQLKHQMWRSLPSRSARMGLYAFIWGLLSIQYYLILIYIPSRKGFLDSKHSKLTQVKSTEL